MMKKAPRLLQKVGVSILVDIQLNNKYITTTTNNIQYTIILI